MNLKQQTQKADFIQRVGWWLPEAEVWGVRGDKKAKQRKQNGGCQGMGRGGWGGYCFVSAEFFRMKSSGDG